MQNENEEIMYFIKEIENCFPVIKAGRVIKTDRKTFLSFFVNIANHFIAIVQLHKAFNR